MTRIQILATKVNFVSTTTSKKSSEEHPASNPMVTVGVLPTGLDYSLSYTYNRNLSTPHVFMAWCLSHQ
jgi:hypothetical protein